MQGVDVYKRVSVESKVNSSSPYELVVILYETAITEAEAVKRCIEQKDYENKAKHVDKFMRIMSDGLRSALNMEQGGATAENLFSLYTFLNSEIIAASVSSDLAKVDSCIQILSELKSAWMEISKSAV